MSIYGFRTEPVLVSAVVAALLALLVEFGVPLTDGQADKIQLLIGAVFVLLARSQVASQRTLDRAGTDLEEVARLAKDDAVVLVPRSARSGQWWPRG